MSETGSVRLANWRWTSVGDLGDVSGGVTKNSSKANLSITLPYLRVANVYANELRLDDIAEIGVTQTESVRALLVKGDLLIVEGNGSIDQIGRVAIWSGKISPCLHQNHLIKVRFAISGLEPFVLYWLLSPDGRQHVVRAASSTSGLHTLSLSKVASLPAPLAPLHEQHRVVEAIESYFTRLDDAVATLERVQRKLKRYRASVLKAAVEGRLVPTEADLARAEGRDYEPASALLERILAERRRRWQEARSRVKYREPIAADTSDLPKLPEGWCWATVDALIWDAGYGTSQKCTHEATGPPVLRIPNVQNQAIGLDDLKFATQAESLNPDGIVEPGDLLFIRTNGSRGLIGRGSVMVQQLPRGHHFASYLIRLRIVNVDAVPRWTGLAWHAPVLRSQILAEAASSAGQYNVSLTAARTFAVPLPPLAEQQRIIAEVERTTSLVDACEGIAAASQGRCARLRQSILKWAFEGRLAEQDPSDEPASALLERIRSQMSASRQSASDTHDRPRRRRGSGISVRTESKP